VKNVGELSCEQLLLVCRQLQLRERGNALDVRNGERSWHIAMLMQISECKMHTPRLAAPERIA
jgi:hypothetical protein